MSISISVVLPAYKEDFLERAIESILTQSYADFELIVVNDHPGSKIKTIVSRFSDVRIRYYENVENIGGKNLIRNWNNCIGYASGQYMVLASDDDEYDKDYLAEMINLTQKHPTCNLYYCRIRYIDKHGNTLQISQPALEYETPIDFIYQRLIWNRKQALQEFFFRTSALKAAGGFVDFPLAWYSDDATLALMSLNGVAYSDKILFNMRLSGQNISTGNLHRKKKIEALRQYILWLDTFLPILSTYNKDDIFMKNKLLAEYRPILNYRRLISVGKLNIKNSFIGYKALIDEGVYGRNFVYRQVFKRIIGLV